MPIDGDAMRPAQRPGLFGLGGPHRRPRRCRRHQLRRGTITMPGGLCGRSGPQTAVTLTRSQAAGQFFLDTTPHARQNLSRVHGRENPDQQAKQRPPPRFTLLLSRSCTQPREVAVAPNGRRKESRSRPFFTSSVDAPVDTRRFEAWGRERRTREIAQKNATETHVTWFGTKRSLVQIQSPRLFLETSPSASTSKGFLIVKARVASSRRQFKKTISRIRRLAA